MCAQWAEQNWWQRITGGCIPAVLKMSLCCCWGQLSCWWRTKPCSSTSGTFKCVIFDSSITFMYFTLLPPHTHVHTPHHTHRPSAPCLTLCSSSYGYITFSPNGISKGLVVWCEQNQQWQWWAAFLSPGNGLSVHVVAADMLKRRCTPAGMGGGDTCAHVPWFLLKCSSTAASGASRWHCTAVCGTGLCSADPLSVCLACPLEQLLCSLGNLDASFPSFTNPFLLFLFSTAIFAYGQMALASISNR